MRIIRMSEKELQRSEIISRVINGNLTQRKAGEYTGISLRQIKRLCKRYRNEGVQGLAHRSRGKSSNKKISQEIRSKVLELIKNDYPDFGPQLIQEQLQERNQIRVSREWIRRLIIDEGLWKVRKRKTSKFYQRRNRRSREGELIQIDGSPEYWFENRGPRCCLINMVDDATGKIMEMRFVRAECLEGYFKGMERYIKTHGRPIALYTDRHLIFKSPKTEEKLSLTQFGRAMKELDIDLIFAGSPQAKGRVERSHGTLQDRLIKIMRLDGISSIEEGNRYLETYRKKYNTRFGRQPQSSENTHRELFQEQKLDRILCTKEKRKVAKSLEVKYKHKTYQLVSKGMVNRLVGKTVLVCERNNELRIELDGEEYDYKIFEERPHQDQVMERKKIDAFLDWKQPMSVIEKHRKGISVNF